MRLVSYHSASGLRSGIEIAGTVVDTALLARSIGIEAPLGSNRRVLELDEAVRSSLAASAHEAVARGAESAVASLELNALRLGPPIPDPDKIIGVALNYHDHAAETGMQLPSAPPLFAKFTSSLVGPTDDVLLPPNSAKVDYEAELAVVIGTRCKHIAPEDAVSAIAGAMAFNDVTARDLQAQTTQLTNGKALDTFAPCGPALVTLDELGDLDDLSLETRVNGELLQDSSTAQMIFSSSELVSFVSSLMTLLPGDIIATGTPGGIGARRDPPRFLHDGDVVEVSLDRVGTIRNRCVGEAMTIGGIDGAVVAHGT